jgi:S-methylmethionine-dependent homocysteine/selenocysteine methylase
VPFQQPEWLAKALMEAPDTVVSAHEEFIAAGADVVTTSNYAVVPFHLGEERFDARVGDLVALAGRLARVATEGGSPGPGGWIAPPRSSAATSRGGVVQLLPPGGDGGGGDRDAGRVARHDLDSGGYSRFVERWLDTGAEIVGGCCGIMPRHIAELHALRG